MKKYISVLFIIQLNILSAQNQLVVTYKVADNSALLDENEIKKAPEGIQFAFEKTQLIYPHLEFKLYVSNKNESYFETPKSSNSIVQGLPQQLSDMLYKIAVGNVSDGNFYTNLENSVFIREIELDGDKFLISINSNRLDWKLTKETKQINGINCFKAISTFTSNNSFKKVSKNISAWYAPSIPISLGPNGYNGLPGLILELQINNMGMYASSIDFKPKIEIKVSPPKNGKKITEEEFFKIEKEKYDKTISLYGG